MLRELLCTYVNSPATDMLCLNTRSGLARQRASCNIERGRQTGSVHVARRSGKTKTGGCHCAVRALKAVRWPCFLTVSSHKRALDLEQRKQDQPLETVMQLVTHIKATRFASAALKTGSGVRLIAEVKRASPSKGMLAPHIHPVELARTYEKHGAAAISVLTEPHFFLGSPEYLTAIKQAVHVPVLRKDFIIDEYQVYEARAWGADAILLICAILDDTQLHHLLTVAHQQGMHCLVEVHNAVEAQRAVTAGAMIIGVNSRDLVTFSMSPLPLFVNCAN